MWLYNVEETIGLAGWLVDIVGRCPRHVQLRLGSQSEELCPFGTMCVSGCTVSLSEFSAGFGLALAI